MTRPLRPDPQDGWHHVMSRGVNRSAIFADDQDRLLFGRLLGVAVERFGVEIHAYCLMGNHFHLLLRCPDGGLSAAMHHLLSNYARIVNDSSGRVGHLFGDRFCSRLVTSFDYIVNVVRYIHLNPLDIAGVTDIGRYRWSSHRTYLGLRRCPDWLTTDTILGWFTDRRDFDRFVRSRRPDARDAVVATPGDIVDSIDFMLTEHSESSPRHLPAQRRAAALLLTDSMAAQARNELHERLGIASDGARRTALSRARRLRLDEPVVVEVAERVRMLLEPRGIDGPLHARSA